MGSRSGRKRREMKRERGCPQYESRYVVTNKCQSSLLWTFKVPYQHMRINIHEVISFNDNGRKCSPPINPSLSSRLSEGGGFKKICLDWLTISNLPWFFIWLTFSFWAYSIYADTEFTCWKGSPHYFSGCIIPSLGYSMSN